MTTKDEALKLALEALEEPKEHIAKHRRLEAITAIKEALAQPEQKPVAKVIDWGIEGPRLKGLTEDWPRVGTLLYACPSQRTWVGLTDEERNDCLVDADPCECLATPEAEELMRCIEAKLKEKNT